MQLPPSALVLAALLATTHLADAQHIFRGLPAPAGYSSGVPWAISGDGRTIAGTVSNGSPVHPARWIDGVVEVMSHVPGESVRVNGISENGQFTIGDRSLPTPAIAIIWDAQGRRHELPLPPGSPHSFGTALNADGSIAVGHRFDGVRTSAYRRLADGTIEDLGTFGVGSYASSVSRDGDVVAGYCTSPQRAFRWTPHDGLFDLGTLLPNHSTSVAAAVSADGRVIVGYSGNWAGDFRAFFWTEELGMQNGGVLPGWNYSSFKGVSGDGSIMVGHVGDLNYNTRAMASFPGIGMVDLNSYLPTIGIDLSGWTLLTAAAISADGSTIAGTGRHNGVWQSWSFTFVPAPSGMLLPALLLLVSRRARTHPSSAIA